MREMKDSGAKWIGKIPVHWKSNKLKYHLNRKEPKNPGDMTVLSLYRELGVIPKDSRDDNHNQTSEDTSKYKYVKPGNFVVNKMKAWQGSVAVSNYEGIVSPAYYVYEFTDEFFDKRYFHHLLRGCYKDEFMRLSGGMRVGQWDLSSEDLDNTLVVIPPIDEQIKIAEFLDAKCSEIDALVEDIQSQIGTLEQYKRSTIAEAVTKGINRNTDMKDSGAGWLGEIPSHWKTDKFKYRLSRSEPRNPGNMIVLSLYRELGIIPKDSRDDNHNQTSEDTSKYKHVKPGNFVVNKMKAWQGSVAVSDYEGIISPAYYVYKFRDASFDKKYFHYLLRGCYKDEFMRLSGGMRVGQWDLSAEDLENTTVIIPPLEEQTAISMYLDKKCSDIDTCVETKKEQITTLEAYKKSIIFEYVTGKKEV